MGKTCPKCGEYVSCRKWMYCSKMCRRCDWQFRGKKLHKEKKLRKSKLK